MLAGDIAQLARAAALQAVGRGFKSHYLHESGDSPRVDRSEVVFDTLGKGSRKVSKEDRVSVWHVFSPGMAGGMTSKLQECVRVRHPERVRGACDNTARKSED